MFYLLYLTFLIIAYVKLPDNWLRDLQAVLHLSGIEAGSGSQNALSTALSGGDAAQKLITDEQDPFKKEVRTQLSLCYSNLAGEFYCLLDTLRRCARQVSQVAEIFFFKKNVSQRD